MNQLKMLTTAAILASLVLCTGATFRFQGARGGSQSGGQQGGSQHGGSQQEQEREPHYEIIMSPSVAPKIVNHSHSFAVRAGNRLITSSITAMTSFFNKTIITPGGVYNELLQVLDLIDSILNEAGCTFNEVYSMNIYSTVVDNDGEIDRALKDFGTDNKIDYKFAGHLHKAGQFANGGNVKVDVQAINCKWPQHKEGESQHAQKGQGGQRGQSGQSGQGGQRGQVGQRGQSGQGQQGQQGGQQQGQSS